MKIWIICIMGIISLSLQGQVNQTTGLGIGFLIPENPYKFDDNNPPQNIFSDKACSIKSDSKNIFPFFRKPDYGLYHFICLEKTERYYKVLINDSEIGFIPNNTDFYFKTWSTLLMKSSVQRISKEIPIRSNYTAQGKTFDYPCQRDLFTVEDIIEVNGEYWMYVSYAENCVAYPDQVTKLNYGWLKWRDQKKLFVTILLLC